MQWTLRLGGAHHLRGAARHPGRARGALVYGPYRPPERAARRRRERTGTEPRTALSDLRLRRTLSRVFGALFVVGAAGFAVLAWRASPGPAPNRDTFVFFAALCAGFAVIAAVDLAVLARRLRTERSKPRTPYRAHLP